MSKVVKTRSLESFVVTKENKLSRDQLISCLGGCCDNPPPKCGTENAPTC